MSTMLNTPTTSQRPLHWSVLRPWHTNAALCVLGFAMIWFTRQLISENDHYTIGTSGVSSSHFALYLAAVLIFLLKPTNVNRYTFPIIITVAVACRLVALFPDPFLSSDVYRYAWDGVVQHAHINPFRYVPGNKAIAFLRAPNQDLFDHINRRDYAHTIYPPAAQVIFYVITFINASVTGMKAGMILFEGLTMWGLVLLLRELGLNREWTLLYAWCPLLIWEIGSSGHVDSIVMAFVVFALLFRYRRQPVLTGLFLGLAVLTKFYPLVLFPALYRRGDWKMPTTMAALAVALYSIYLSVGLGVFGFFGGYMKEEGMDSGQRYFLLDLVQRLPGLHHLPNVAFVVFAALVFSSIALWSWRTGCQPDSRPDAFLPPAFAFALALMLFFAPHYPWYVAWLIPFLVLMPNLTVMTYVGGLFYLCTTEIADGSAAGQFHLNKILYGWVALAFVVELAWRHLPITRRIFQRPQPAPALFR